VFHLHRITETDTATTSLHQRGDVKKFIQQHAGHTSIATDQQELRTVSNLLSSTLFILMPQPLSGGPILWEQYEQKVSLEFHGFPA